MKKTCEICFNTNIYPKTLLCAHCFNDIHLHKSLCMYCIIDNYSNITISGHNYIMCETCLKKYVDELSKYDEFSNDI